MQLRAVVAGIQHRSSRPGNASLLSLVFVNVMIRRKRYWEMNFRQLLFRLYFAKKSDLRAISVVWLHRVSAPEPKLPPFHDAAAATAAADAELS